jgi:hypothetical protein
MTTIPACMGGWCSRRLSCAHHQAVWRRGEPAERLCRPGGADVWQPLLPLQPRPPARIAQEAA